MKLFTTAALAILLSSGMAYAQSQDDTVTGATPDAGTAADSGGTNGGNYLTGPNIQRFYQDEQQQTLLPEAEIRTSWDAMTQAERDDLRAACVDNTDPRFDQLCVSIQAL